MDMHCSKRKIDMCVSLMPTCWKVRRFKNFVPGNELSQWNDFVRALEKHKSIYAFTKPFDASVLPRENVKKVVLAEFVAAGLLRQGVEMYGRHRALRDCLFEAARSAGMRPWRL